MSYIEDKYFLKYFRRMSIPGDTDHPASQWCHECQHGIAGKLHAPPRPETAILH